MPILSGAVPVRIDIEEKSKNWMLKGRYEVMIYVDGVFLFEDEDAVAPYNYTWNTKGLSEGTHILTVNILNYEGHIGIKSVKVFVDK